MGDGIDLVLLTGTPHSGGTGMRAQLAASRDALAEIGVHVVVPELRTADGGLELARSLVKRPSEPETTDGWDRVVLDARAIDASVVVVSCDELVQVLTFPINRRRLRRRTVSGLGGSVRMVLTLRDQLSNLNVVYASGAADLRRHWTFESFVAAPEARRLNYTGMQGAAAGADEVLYIANDALERGNGLEIAMDRLSIRLRDVPLPTFQPDVTPGVLDVQVGLLVRRLARARGRRIPEIDRPRVTSLVGDLAEDTPNPEFWGWTKNLIDEHVPTYAHEAMDFAERMGAMVPPLELRPPQRPETSALPEKSLVTLLDTASEIVEACGRTSASGRSSPEVEQALPTGSE